MLGSGRFWHKPAMLLQAILDPEGAAAAEREAEREIERLHPERETLLLAAAGAAKVLGPDHSATKAFAKAAVAGAGLRGGWRSQSRSTERQGVHHPPWPYNGTHDGMPGQGADLG